MMFEKQCKSGTDKIKASSSSLENPSAVSSDAIQDSPVDGEVKASERDHRKPGTDLGVAKTITEEGPDELCEQQESPQETTPDDLELDACGTSSQPLKRPRTSE